MIEVSYTRDGDWSVLYRMEGVRCTEVLTRDMTVALLEIERKLRLMRGLAHGKTFTTGKE